jgi:hypothetical protein
VALLDFALLQMHQKHGTLHYHQVDGHMNLHTTSIVFALLALLVALMTMPACHLASQERLAVSNRQLKQWHRVLGGKVAGLMSTDLVRHKHK